MTDYERDLVNPTGQSYEEQQGKRWRAEFPYHWDADELVSRRQLLQFTVYTSGALFASTGILAALGLLTHPGTTKEQPIVNAGEVAEGEAYYFQYPEPGDEAMLVHLPGGQFVAYSQKCTHLACSVYYQEGEDRLYCPCHEGIFDLRTGEPTAGPPQRRLPRIALRQDGDMLVAMGLEP